jgi:perosamine synthetase
MTTTGARPRAHIPLSVPVIAGREMEYVRECIETGWVSSAGKFVERFERAVAEATGARQAVAVQSGTAALHVALVVAGVERDTEVVAPALTFVAPVNAIAYCGAHPVFVDVEPDHWQLDVHKVEAFLAERCERATDGAVRNRRTGRRVSAVVGVHLLGHPFDLDRLRAVCDRHGLPLVQDAAQSIGARYRGAPVGSAGDYVALSFNGNKVVTCGGGGAFVSESRQAADRVRHLTTQAKQDPLYFVHDAVGYNYRLTNVAAAIGTAQLERLAEFVERKRAIQHAYERAFAADARVEMVREAEWARSSFWLPTLRVCTGGRALRDAAMRALKADGIESRPPWHPNHRQPPFAGSESFAVEHADAIADTGLHLPGSPSLTDDEQAYVVERLLAALERGTAA